MSDQITRHGSAMLTGTRRRLVKAGAAVAWTVPVMHTLTAQQAFAVTPRVTVTLRETTGGPCTDRPLQPRICCNTEQAYFIRISFCGPCASGEVTATLPSLLAFQTDPVKVCLAGTEIAGTATVTDQLITVTGLNLTAGQCANVDLHVKRATSCDSTTSISVPVTLKCGGTTIETTTATFAVGTC